MSRILQDTELTMDQTECVATIQHCGETLLSVINSILDYTKLEASGK
jgi:two-component system, sensor histidine kinase